jgi:thioredoxin reductase
MYIALAKKHNISILTETMVFGFNKNRTITVINKDGVSNIQAKAIVLAMGCREKTRWQAMIPGTRPSGIYTAGVAQAFINLYNIMPGKNVLILGSGDVGLIMARRLKFEGANVLGVIEILPFTSGLPRNVVQCLDDYDIPLYLNHTVTHISGKERLSQVTIAQIDKNMKIISGTEKTIICDTLLLSLGLTPENELSLQAGVNLDEITGGPSINQHFETTLPGIFACGNCLQVYDTVDMLATDAKQAGKHAALYTESHKVTKNAITMTPAEGVRYVLPQRIDTYGNIQIMLRASKPQGPSTLSITSKKKIFLKKKLPWVNPANIITIPITIDKTFETDTLEVRLHEN